MFNVWANIHVGVHSVLWRFSCKSFRKVVDCEYFIFSNIIFSE